MGDGHTLARQLPPELEKAVRLSAVPPHIRAAFELLPEPLLLQVELPEGVVELPEAARQLLKLALLGLGARLLEVRTADRPCIVVVLRDREKRLSERVLASDWKDLLPAVVGSVFRPDDIGNLLDRLATQSSRLLTLRHVTSRMLAARDLEQAQRLMLAGLTSGFGLGFHRAVLFLRDTARGAFVGARAVGPADEHEAHRIWESLELEDASIDRILSATLPANESSLDKLAVRVVLREDEEPLKTVLSARGALVGDARLLAGSQLMRLDPASPFLMAALRIRGEVAGVVFADDRFAPVPISAERLAHAELLLDQTALVLQNLTLLEHVSQLARTDPLTGLLNRRELEARFDTEKSRSLREHAPLSMLVIDVDRFKQKNDSEGHEAGDAMLQDLATLLSRSFRAHDAVARFGGDEFVVLLPGIEPTPLRTAARRLGRQAFDAGISLSIGGSSWPSAVGSPDGLFAAADSAVYEAKQAGRALGLVCGEQLDFRAD